MKRAHDPHDPMMKQAGGVAGHGAGRGEKSGAAPLFEPAAPVEMLPAPRPCKLCGRMIRDVVDVDGARRFLDERRGALFLVFNPGLDARAARAVPFRQVMDAWDARGGFEGTHCTGAYLSHWQSCPRRARVIRAEFGDDRHPAGQGMLDLDAVLPAKVWCARCPERQLFLRDGKGTVQTLMGDPVPAYCLYNPGKRPQDTVCVAAANLLRWAKDGGVVVPHPSTRVAGIYVSHFTTCINPGAFSRGGKGRRSPR